MYRALAKMRFQILSNFPMDTSQIKATLLHADTKNPTWNLDLGVQDPLLKTPKNYLSTAISGYLATMAFDRYEKRGLVSDSM